MTPLPPRSGPAREAGPIVVAAGVVVLVALLSFARIRVPADDESVGADLSWPAGVALQSHRDPDLGLEITLPADWERVFASEAAQESDVRVVFRSPVGRALRMDGWNSTTLAPFPLWLGVMAGDISSSGAQGQANATLSGTPAWVLRAPPGSAETGGVSAYLSRAGRYLRISYLPPEPAPAASAEPAAGDDFRRILASVRWLEGGGEVRIPVLDGGASPLNP